MKKFAPAALTASLFATTSALSGPVTMDWVTVGNAGNAPDPFTNHRRGSVAYDYRIGKYEVTNAQYAAFLNSVAASDPNELYNVIGMGSSKRGGITRAGSEGSYTYSVKPNMGNKPVVAVNWYDAARFCNWVTNGQPSEGGTESGVYSFTGPSTIIAITRDLSNPNQVFLPTEDEWYKAAYHQPASQGGHYNDYWLYATQSWFIPPTMATATSTGDVANPGAHVINYANGADWNGENGNITTVGSAGTPSFYGAFDMNGNVAEWNESLRTSVGRGVGGGSFNSMEASLRSSGMTSMNATTHSGFHGFRLASPVPGPGSLALLGATAPLLVRRRRISTHRAFAGGETLV